MERIGLAAILDMGDFNRGAKSYSSIIGSMSAQTTSAAGSMGGAFIGLGKGILNFGATVAKTALVGVGALTAGITGLGAVALNEFTKYERLSSSVQSLVARELSQGQEVEQQRRVLTGLSADERAEIEKLTTSMAKKEAAMATLNARLNEQREKVRQMTEEWTDQGLATQTAKARLAEMEVQYQQAGQEIDGMRGRISELNSKNGQMVTVIDKVRVGQMSMTDAMAQAGPKAKELLDWITKLAVISPFDQEGVATAFRTALAYGFTTDRAQTLTTSMIDFASATGQNVDVMNQIALALGQMQAKGKVSGQELIQLTNAGVGVNQILGRMGFTLDDVSDGLVDSDDFIQAVIDDFNVFEGAAAAQANTWSGLLNSMSDLTKIRLREFFTSTFQAVQPLFASFVDFLSGDAGASQIREWGDAIGGAISGLIARIPELTKVFQSGGLFGSAATGSAGLLSALGIGPEISGQLESVVTTVQSAFTRIQGLMATFQAGGLFGSADTGAGGLVAALGITPDLESLLGKISATISGVAATVTGAFMPALSSISGSGVLDVINQGITLLDQNFDALVGAIAGVGAVLAGGIFIGLVAGVASLLSPLTLVAAGAALLGAAWAGNWFNIQGITQSVIGTMTEIIGVFGSVFSTYVLPPIQEAINSITTQLNAFGFTWSDIWNAVSQAAQIVAGVIGATILGMISTIGGLVTGTASALATAATYWTDFVNNAKMVLESLTQFFLGWVQIAKGILTGDLALAFLGVGNVIGGLANTIAGVFNSIVTVIQSGVATALSFVQGFSDGFLAIFQGIYDALVGHSIVPDLMSRIGELFGDLPALLKSSLGGLSTFVSNLFKNTLGGGILQSAQDIMNAFKQILDFKNALSQEIAKFYELGASIIDGILQGIEENIYKVMDVLKEMARAALRSAANAIGFGSPAARFVPLGSSIMQGLTVGVNQSAGDFQDALFQALNVGGALRGAGMRRSRAQDLSGLVRGWMGPLTQGLQNASLTAEGLHYQMQQIAVSMNFPPGALQDYINFDDVLGQINNSYNTLLTSQRLAAQAKLIENAGGFMGLGQTAANRMLAVVEKEVSAAEDEMKSLRAVKLLDDKEVTTIGDIADEMADLVTRRDLLAASGQTLTDQELARLAALEAMMKTQSRYADLQSIITREKQKQADVEAKQAELAQKQADLQFLQQQVGLLQTVRDMGLDPKEIFGGIQFGINATLRDIIDATSRVVDSIIGQVDADLQIASPSKVMARKGAQIMAGIQQGIDQFKVNMPKLSQLVEPAGRGTISRPVTNNSRTANVTININGAQDPELIRQQVQRVVMGTV